MIKLAIANDANISNARKQLKLTGAPPSMTEQQQKTPEELQQDLGFQESEAIRNLEDLGFGYIISHNGSKIPASRVLADNLSGNPDELIKFNALYPSIKRDLLARFNPKLITIDFFNDFLNKYFLNFDQSKGLAPGEGIELLGTELRQILPDRELLQRLATRIRKLNEKPLESLLDKIEEMIRVMPDASFYQAIDTLKAQDPVEAHRILQRVEDNLASLPTRQDMEKILQREPSSKRDETKILSNAAASISDTMIDNQTAILNDLNLNPQQTKKSSGSSKQKTTSQPSFFMAPDEFNALDVATKRELLSTQFQILKANTGIKLKKELKNAGDDDLNASFPIVRQQYLASLDDIPLLDADSPEETYNKMNQNSAINAAKTIQRGERSQKDGVGFRLSKIGKGIAVEKEPTYIEFGKYAIHLGQLKNYDILNVKYKSLGGIPHFKPTPVSDILKDFLIDVLDTGKANQRVYESVPPEERKLFERVATGAGVFHSLKLKKTITNQDKDELNRFEILKGEYLAGNNSPKLLHELRRFIVKYMGDGKISRNEGMNLLMELSI